MADDRVLEDPTTAIGRLERKIAEMEAREATRAPRRPTGDIEQTLRTTPKDGTLLLQGQTLNRADHPALWAWVEQSGAAGFGTGNGSTTFVLPDMRGRVPIGAGALGADTYTPGTQVGAARVTLAQNQIPSHTHTATTNTAGTHNHDSANGEMGSSGDHGGHFPGRSVQAAAGPDLGLADWQSPGGNRGGHSHFFTFDILNGGSHTHTVTVSATPAATTPVDVRQPALVLNWLIWT